MDILKRVFRRSKAKELLYGSTHAGRRRDSNEDCYLLLPEVSTYIVADGMGGHNAGEVASLNAVKVMREYFTTERVSKMRNDRGKIKEEMIYAVMQAHEQIAEVSRTKAEYAGMGSTIAVSFIHDNVLHTCHVGDSRVYVVNPSGITQITRDHSTVAELVRIGEMTKEEARRSPLKNQITQALGIPSPISPEYNRTYTLNKGDVVLLCSDGLWEMLSDEEIQSIVTEGRAMEETCKRLIHQANAAGGDDNITVVLVQIQ
jgi:serine/threonine protein phosphatase PrpC